jgi:hypothetical protein
MQGDSGGRAQSACLTDAELASLQSAPPGQAPQALALHLAGCERCQQRALFGSEKRPQTRRRRAPEWPSRRQALLLLVAVLATLAMLFYSLQRLSGLAR